MARHQTILALTASFLIAIGSAKTAVPQQKDQAQAEPTFERDVLPILNSHCLQCHGGLNQKSGLDLRTLPTILKGGKQGAAIVIGKPDESRLIKMIANDTMPPKAIKVTKEQKETIRRWIASGAKSSLQSGGAVTIPAKARTAEELSAFIDREIDARLAREKIPASPAAQDGEFLRRIYLDMHGRIPTRSQAQAFLDSKEPNKRQLLVDSLLADPAYGQYWARLWRDRVAVPVAAGEDLRSTHTQAFHKWLTDEFNQNRPWNEIVREIITAEAETPPIAFVRQCMDDGQPRAAKLAASASRRFLGVQLQCAECHDHPFTSWKQDDFWGLAAFFSRTARVEKNRTETRVGIFDTEAGPPGTRFGLKPLVRKEAGAIILPQDAGPHAGKVVSAKFLEGEAIKLNDKEPARPLLAEWITSPKNPFFARATVNRLWAQVFGRGLVDPVDSLDMENLPSHPELLDTLAGELVASGYDLKRMLKGMLLSRAYQRSHQPAPGNEMDTTLLSHANIKIVPPESFYDCLVIASGGDLTQKDSGVIATSVKKSRGVMSSRGEFLKLFGTADIDGNSNDYTQGIPQVLSLLNEAVTNENTKLIDLVVKEGGDAETIVNRIFVAVLSRQPNADELKLMSDFLAARASNPARYQAIWWALVNSPEFASIP